MPKISARTLEEHRLETIERLIDAWADLVMRNGYDEVSLADVAAQAGLARTAIYNYFPDREALLFAWTERELHRAITGLEQMVAEAKTSADKLRLFVRAQLEDFSTRHLPPGREVIQFLRPETYERFMQHLQPLEEILSKIVRQGIEQGEFTGVDPDDAVPMVMACIGAERAPLASKTHGLDEATERVTSFVLRALQGGKAPARKTSPKGKPAQR